MSHDIEMSDDGRAMFAAYKDGGWHQLGTVSDEPLTVEEGMRLIYINDLDYRVVPLIAVDHSGEKPAFVGADPYRAVIRYNPWKRDERQVLGAGMTEAFTLHRPEEFFAFGESIIDQGHSLSALGSLAGGRLAFAAFSLEGVTIGGVDQVNMFLNLMTGFTGTMSTIARASGIRVVCRNTMNAVLGQAEMPTYRVRHIGGGLSERVDEARATLGVGWKGLRQFQEEAERMIQRSVTDAEFERLVESLITVPEDATERVKSARLLARSQVQGLWDGPTVANIRGTAWGALNAYTEWVDWTGGSFRSPENRMVAQITTGSVIDARRERAGRIIARSLSLV